MRRSLSDSYNILKLDKNFIIKKNDYDDFSKCTDSSKIIMEDNYINDWNTPVGGNICMAFYKYCSDGCIEYYKELYEMENKCTDEYIDNEYVVKFNSVIVDYLKKYGNKYFYIVSKDKCWINGNELRCNDYYKVSLLSNFIDIIRNIIILKNGDIFEDMLLDIKYLGHLVVKNLEYPVYGIHTGH